MLSNGGTSTVISWVGAQRRGCAPGKVIGGRVLRRRKSTAAVAICSLGQERAVPGGHLDVTPDPVDQELDLATSEGDVGKEGDVAITCVSQGKPVYGFGCVEPSLRGQL